MICKTMTVESSVENLFIFYDNLSMYYVGSVIVTLLSVIFAWWHNKNSLICTFNEEQMQESLADENCSKLVSSKLQLRN